MTPYLTAKIPQHIPSTKRTRDDSNQSNEPIGTFFAAGVLAVFALEGFFAGVSSLMLDERTFGGSGVDAHVATEGLLARVRAQVGRQRSLLGRSVLAEIALGKKLVGREYELAGREDTSLLFEDYKRVLLT